MGIAYRLDQTQGLTIVVWDGTVTEGDVEEQVRRLAADPDWPPGLRQLSDMTSATSVPDVANTNIIEMIAEMPEARPIRFAFVAREGFAAVRRYERAVETVGVTRVIVFNDLPTACTWLGVDEVATRATIDALRQELRGHS